MNYHRLQDIKTPPFAYVVNRDRLLSQCARCFSPFVSFASPMEIELLSTQPEQLTACLDGQPVMAENWLVGDETFVQRFSDLVGHELLIEPVTLVQHRSLKRKKVTVEGRLAHLRWFSVFPRVEVHLDLAKLGYGQDPQCEQCGRTFPDLPFDFRVELLYQPNPPPFARVAEMFLEGYDYLFLDSLVPKLLEAFPGFLLRPLDQEPFLF
jgi:hypothetical protein